MQKKSINRCDWVRPNPMYIDYHDNEWGVPQKDGKKLFEMICLEGQQTGLSWITVLKKRQYYRDCFYQFDPVRISCMTNKDVERLLLNSKIISHRGKVQAIIDNARAYLAMEKRGELFNEFVWSFVDNVPKLMSPTKFKDIPVFTPVSNALSNALKKRGFKFIGSKMCYAFMQACGLINNHITDCICYTNRSDNDCLQK